MTDETIDAYLKPHVRTQQRTRDLERFVESFDNEHTVRVEPQLRALNVPGLIVWGDDDVYFDVNPENKVGDTDRMATLRVADRNGSQARRVVMPAHFPVFERNRRGISKSNASQIGRFRSRVRAHILPRSAAHGSST
jgi:pimeloyl-ACP methyl ester carboxylesterase